MNYAGPFEFSQSGDAPAEPTAGGGSIGHTFSAHTAGSAIVVQDANLLFSGDYKRSGVDLVLSKDGHEHVVSDYFKGSLRAALSSPDGAQLSGDLVTALVGEVQVAQLGGGANAAAQVIGTVSKLAGSATAIRNGVSVTLNVGDQVQKGDVVQAGADSSLTMTFIDGTVFGLSANARMVLNEMVYDPQGSANSSLLSLVQGTITFVAGETAKHGNMRVDTPVATMGIRGTAVLVEIGFEVPGQGGAPPVKFQVLVEPNGVTGSYVLYSKTSGQAIGTVNAAGQVTSVLGNGDTSTGIADPLTPIARAIIEQTLQTYFPNYVPNANPRSGPGGGSSPGDPNSGTSPDPLKFIIPDFLPNQPYTVPIKLQGDGSNTSPIDVTFTRFNTAPTITVAPVVVMLPVDKTSFEIKDQVHITDPDSGDVATPYVPGTAHIISASGPTGTPTSLDLKSLITVDPQTGHVSYDPAVFKFLAAGQQAVYTIGFDSQSGPDTTHETLTFTVDGSNDAPVVTTALTAAANQDDGAQSFNLLAGASDADLGETATLTVGNVKFALNGGFAQPAAPTGVTLNGTTLHVDPGAFAYLGEGQTATIKVTYNIIDAHGASVAQTETITITGVNDAPVITGTSIEVVLGGATVLSDTSFAVSDPDGTTDFTFTVSNVIGGSFEVWDGAEWVPATNSVFERLSVTNETGTSYTFTSEQLAQHHVRFVSDGSTSQPTFTVQVDDGGSHNNLSAPYDGTVTPGDNHAPVVEGDVALTAIAEDHCLIITEAQLLANATDVDGQALHVTGLAVANGCGTLTYNEDGTWTFTPAANFNGPVSFTYQISDDVTSVSGGATLAVTPVNDLPSGKVTISGTFQEGATITAQTGSVADVDGLGTFHYQWYRSSPGSNEPLEISQATGSSYVLTSADAGLTVYVVVSYTDGGGTAETVASGPTGVIIGLGASNVWTGAAHDNNWTTPGNWSLGIVPTADEIVYINAGTVTFNLNGLLEIAGLHIGAQAELDLTGTGALNVTGTLVNDGDIQLAPGTTLEVNGVVQNTGTLLVDDHTAGATLLIHGTVTLDGEGTVTLDGSADRITGDSFSSKLINADNTINGYGKLGDGKLSIVNECDGKIIASNYSHALIIDTGKGSLINFGVIASMATGGLEIKGDLVNYGTIEAYAGLFEIGGDVTGHGTARISGGNLEFGGWSNANVIFSGVSSDELILDRGSHFVGTVSGLSYGDTIDLKGISPWQLWFDQHDGVVDVHYGWGKNDYFTLTDPGVLKHLDIDSDHRGGTEMTWKNDAPEFDTSSAELSKRGDGSFKISDISVWDWDSSGSENYQLDINGHVVKSGSLASIDHYLEDGFTFRPSSSDAPQATVAVTITDGFGASEHVNFIFNTAPLQPNTQVSLTGTGGNDVIFATVNKDTLTGGHGSDQFVFGSHSGSIDKDIVTDFEVGIDKIVLDHIRGVPNLSGPLGDLKLALWELSGGIEQKGNNTLIHLDGGDTLQLNNVHMSQLHASDFIVHPYSNVA
ncbi:cadherin-like domain-containing protein [Tardiphaga sp. OK245]|uniref:cadherin-like domain-containing protein n=1 Tax=Tardiphaga sp. OK245 TaxID=1855306 RepID=UPI0008A77007|nr:cadherin-like domain-containing protein [Tardiphaga sp. OK245]SEH75526.1 FecR family protein [Tardiphaga sp. OK245]